ncbi:MAG TPA: VWA domain-containing protein [Pyrinomonadaceae bacterium]|jgi:hypothetical protein
MRTSVRVAIVAAVILFAARAAAAQADVVIAIDLSLSMKINDPGGNRFVGADQFMTMFSLYGRNRGGVVAFGNSASQVIPLDSLSFDQALTYKPILDRLGYEDWTELGLGLKLSRSLLGQSGRRKSVILISDGIVEGNPTARGAPKEQAREQARKELWGEFVPALKRDGVVVYTIGLYNLPSERLAPEQRDGENGLRRIADETGGFYTHVNNPEEFSQIYKRMLDDIGQPAGVAEVTSEKNSIQLTPADDGIIVFGPVRFVVRAPDGVAYSTDRATPDTPVKQKFAEYSNRVGILFLGRPDDIEQNHKSWTGRWSVEDLSGPGEVTYFSNIRQGSAQEGGDRREYFLNEYYAIEDSFAAKPGFDLEEYLKKCHEEYTLIPQGDSAGRPQSGTLRREGNVFKGDLLLDHEGDYILQLTFYYQDTPVKRPPIRLHVNKTPLVELLSPDVAGTQGEGFNVEAKENHAAFTGGSTEFKGLVGGRMTYSLRYGTEDPISLKPVNADSDVYRVTGLEFKKAGDLEIRGELNGKLVSQRPVKGGDPNIGQYNVKALVVRRVKVGNSWFWALLPWGGSSVGFLASVLGIYGFLQTWRLNRFDRGTLTGARSIPFEPAHKGRMRWLKDRPEVSIGGPGSDADVKEVGLKGGGQKPVMHFGVGLRGNYYIARTGDLDVFVNGSPLQESEQREIADLDQIVVRDDQQHDLMKFKFVV